MCPTFKNHSVIILNNEELVILKKNYRRTRLSINEKCYTHPLYLQQLKIGTVSDEDFCQVNFPVTAGRSYLVLVLLKALPLEGANDTSSKEGRLLWQGCSQVGRLECASWFFAKKYYGEIPHICIKLVRRFNKPSFQLSVLITLSNCT